VMRAIKRALSSLVVLLILLCSSATAQHGSTYLGCFTLTRLLYLKGVEGIKVKLYVVHARALALLPHALFDRVDSCSKLSAQMHPE
jgi:hypothetical protein